MQMWLGLVTASRIFPMLNVTAHLKTLFWLSREIYRPPGSNPPRDTEVTCSAHLQTYGSVFFVLCSLYFIVFYIAIVQFDCFHCIERVWCFGMFTFSLKELTPQTVLRFGCVLVKNVLKLILKLFVVVVAFQHQNRSSHSRAV